MPNWTWLIVLASGLSAFLSSMLSMKYSKATMSAEQQQMGGCSTNAMMYMMPLTSLIFSFTVPAGVAVYWTFSNLLAMLQTVILNSMWNPAKIRAQAEAEYAERRRKKKEDKERLKAARLAEQAAWQEEENKARARAKGDITQKKSAATTATPAELPTEKVDEIPEESVNEEDK
jgi:membrane protein insertase Oxa1/YidC/SpoIIIJ